MKNGYLAFILNVFLLGMLFSCSSNQNSIKIDSEGNEQKMVEASPVLIGEIEGRNLIYSYENSEKLERALAIYLEVKKVSNLNIIQAADAYWLSGLGEKTLDSVRLNFALLLHEKRGQNLVLEKDSGVVQYCSATTCCTDCDLQIVSLLSGACECIHNNCQKPGNNGQCVYEVISIGKSKSEYNEMTEGLNDF